MDDTNMSKAINEALDKLGEENSKEIAEAVGKISENVLKKECYKDAMGLSNSVVKGIYGYAYRLSTR